MFYINENSQITKLYDTLTMGATIRSAQLDAKWPTKFNIFWFKIFGVWPTKESSFLYKLYGFSFHMLFTFIYMLFMIYTTFVVDDVEGLMAITCIMLTVVTFFIKIVNLVLKCEQIEDVLGRLQQTLFDDMNDEEKDILKKGCLRSRRLAVLFCWIYLLAGCTATLAPMLADEPVLPFPSWYPFDWQHNKSYFWMLYFFQTVAIYMECIVNSLADAFPACILAITGAQLDTISYRLAHLGKGAETDKHNLKLTTKSVIEWKRVFLQCINSHRTILRLRLELQNVFSTIIFIQALLSAAILCASIFQLSIISPLEQFTEFIRAMSYILAMIAQIFLPCYIGDDVTIKSVSMSYSIYSSNWIDLPYSCKKHIIFFMEKLKFPLIVTVGGIYDLSLKTFTSIINSAYSLYAVLNRVNE